jgi:hypothetical protein
MRNDLHRQLKALGIPLERHDAVSLASVFPPELKVTEFDLSQTDIAEILIAFVKRGLISVSISGETAMRRAAGAHVCHFYRDEDEMVRMTAGFLEEGMRSGERCLWVLPNWLAADRARAASRVARADLADGETSGRLVYLTENEVYLDRLGNLRSAQGIIRFWLEQEMNARAQGFDGIRITGDGTGLVSTDTWKGGVDYEHLANAAFKDRRISALCTYSLAAVSPDRLAQVLSGHECGLIRRNGDWDEIRDGSGVATAIAFFQSVA